VCELDDPRSRGKGLTGDLAGYWRYRIGDYRVLVEVRDDDVVIIAITLGHRSGIY
jgi:mRNA interferase RelE/StbE